MNDVTFVLQIMLFYSCCLLVDITEDTAIIIIGSIIAGVAMVLMILAAPVIR